MSEREPTYVSVVIPAYNEERRLPETIRRAQAYLERAGVPYEIVLVDDGSQDGTGLVARNLSEANGHVRLISNEVNRGKGYSVRRGMLAAAGRFAFYSDADLSAPIEEIERLLPHLEAGADVAMGSRGMDESRLEVRQPWYRESMGRVFNGIVRALVLPGTGFKDTQCGFKGFRRECLRDIFGRQLLDRFAFDVEVIYIARRLGYRVIEVPIRWLNSPESRVRLVSDSGRMLLDVLRIRWYDLQGRYDSAPASPRATSCNPSGDVAQSPRFPGSGG